MASTYYDKVSLSVPNGGTDYIDLEIVESSYNANTNVSTLKIVLGFYVGIRWEESHGGDFYVNIYNVNPDDATGNGNNLSFRWHIGATYGVYPKNEWIVQTYYKDIHCSYDGKAEYFLHSWGWERGANNAWIPSNREVVPYTTYTTNTHDRVSTLTLNNNSLTINNNSSTLSMTINRKSTLMTDHDLLISYPSASGYTTRTLELRQGTTSSNTYTAPIDLLNYLPSNGKSIQGKVVLRTYYLPNWYNQGSTYYADSSPQYFTATAKDSDIAPTITLNGIDWTDDNNVTSSLVGNLNNYILNVSKCKLTGSAETKYRAEISSFGLFTNDNKSIGISNTGTTSNYLFNLNQIASNNNFSASNTLKVKITDSRGMSDSITVPLSFISYIKKSLNDNGSIARINPTSSEVKITSLTGKWWNGNFLGNTNNDLTIDWAYKEASSTGDYITGGTIDTLHYSSGTPSGTYTTYDNATQTFTISNYSFIKNGSTNLFNYQKAYLIRLTVSDAVTAYPANPLYITISAGIANFAIHKDTILINGQTIWDILYPIGSLYLSADYNFDPNTVFTGHTWVRVNGGYYLYAGTSTGQTGTNTGEGALSHTLTSAESGIPAHSHGGTANWISLSGNAYNVMWDDGRSGGMATDGIVSIGGWTRNRSWSGTNGDASRSLGVNASHSHTLTINNNTAADASSGHTHPIATYKVAVWRRTA